MVLWEGGGERGVRELWRYGWNLEIMGGKEYMMVGGKGGGVGGLGVEWNEGMRGD